MKNTLQERINKKENKIKLIKFENVTSVADYCTGNVFNEIWLFKLEIDNQTYIGTHFYQGRYPKITVEEYSNKQKRWRNPHITKKLAVKNFILKHVYIARNTENVDRLWNIINAGLKKGAA